MSRARRLAAKKVDDTVRRMSTVREIEAALEKLPTDAQREVAIWLDARIGPSDFAPGVEEAWSKEVKRRMMELECGQVKGVPAAQVFERVRKALRR
ncbi:MAG: addiction module protein [Verrucomicrobia bacterium]|nr:addiction module protein [Verrucomicrobiota bacterium]